MRLRCLLREFRGSRSLADLADAAGINRGQLSEIERGYRLPREGQLQTLEQAYGAPPEQWYPPRVLAAIDAHDEEG